jgi:hypothetical protein
MDRLLALLIALFGIGALFFAWQGVKVGLRRSIREYDALEHAELARQFRVLTVPTTVVIAPDGGVVAVNYGVTQSNKLQHQLAKATTKQ